MNLLSRRFVIIFFPLALFFLVFALSQKEPSTEKSIETSVQIASASTTLLSSTLSGGTTTIRVTIASTSAERERGLSGKTFLATDEGMLFIFDHSEPYGFWMPDMNFAIDIIWIDSDWRIVDVKENATPMSYPTVFTPHAPARYVLEVDANLARTWGWKKGVQLNFRTRK